MLAIRRSATLLGVALLAAGTTAHAQTTAVRLAVTGRATPTANVVNTPAFTSVAGTAPGTAVTIVGQSVAASVPSPYTGLVTAPTLFTGTLATNVFCADMLNAVSFSTTPFAANATFLGGDAALVATRYTDAGAVTRYRKASVLATRWNGLAGAEVEDLQLAIWSVMYQFTPASNLVPTSLRTTRAPVASFLAWADAVAASGFTGYSFASSYVLTDAAVAGLAPTDVRRYDGVGRQEFVTAATVVPEPASMALLGAGLLALGAAAHRRRQATGGR